MNPHLTLGTIVKDSAGDQWLIGAIISNGGDRYYLLSMTPNDVALMPAAIIEEWEIVEAKCSAT